MKTIYCQCIRNSKSRHIVTLSMVLFLVALFSIARSEALEGDRNRYNGSGELTSIENDNKATIDNRGYLVASNVLVVNSAGRPISLKELSLPSKIHYEYSYLEIAPKTMASTIVYIAEAKKESSNRRSKQ